MHAHLRRNTLKVSHPLADWMHSNIAAKVRRWPTCEIHKSSLSQCVSVRFAACDVADVRGRSPSTAERKF